MSTYTGLGQTFTGQLISLEQWTNDMAPNPQTPVPSSHKPMQGQKLVFRVPNYKSNTSPSCGSEQPAGLVYHSRRSHRKSRGGCVNCKQRRVKVSQKLLRAPLTIQEADVDDLQSVMKPSLDAFDVKNMTSSVITRENRYAVLKPTIAITSLQSLLKQTLS